MELESLIENKIEKLLKDIDNYVKISEGIFYKKRDPTKVHFWILYPYSYLNSENPPREKFLVHLIEHLAGKFLEKISYASKTSFTSVEGIYLGFSLDLSINEFGERRYKSLIRGIIDYMKKVPNLIRSNLLRNEIIRISIETLERSYLNAKDLILKSFGLFQGDHLYIPEEKEELEKLKKELREVWYRITRNIASVIGNGNLRDELRGIPHGTLEDIIKIKKPENPLVIKIRDNMPTFIAFIAVDLEDLVPLLAWKPTLSKYSLSGNHLVYGVGIQSPLFYGGIIGDKVLVELVIKGIFREENIDLIDLLGEIEEFSNSKDIQIEKLQILNRLLDYDIFPLPEANKRLRKIIENSKRDVSISEVFRKALNEGYFGIITSKSTEKLIPDNIKSRVTYIEGGK